MSSEVWPDDASHGPASVGLARHGRRGIVRLGLAGSGTGRRGITRQARRDEARLDTRIGFGRRES